MKLSTRARYGLKALIDLGLHSENDGTCHGSDVCVAKLVWKRINDSITSAVDTLMLGQLIEESRRVHEEKMESQGMEENVPDILK